LRTARRNRGTSWRSLRTTMKLPLRKKSSLAASAGVSGTGAGSASFA
jgi:hypothetical protein